MSASSLSTESTLLRRVQDHDQDAWRKLADLYGPLIYAWCRRANLPGDAAADVTQEVFLAVSRAIGQFDPQRGSFRGWLWTITRSKIFDHFRRRQPGGEGVGGTDAALHLGQLPAELPAGDEGFRRSDLHSLLHRALEQIRGDFEPQTWQAFCLVVLEGKATDEVARQLGTTALNVRQAKSRVLRRLREQLGDNFE